MTSANKGTFVLVTTQHRGVFAGVFVEEDNGGKTVVLYEAQMCVSWSADVQGVFGLASIGPSATCKVTRPTVKTVLQDVTSVTTCTPAAAEAWRRRPWN